LGAYFPPGRVSVQKSTTYLRNPAKSAVASVRLNGPPKYEPSASFTKYDPFWFIRGAKFHRASSSRGQSTSYFFGVSAAPRSAASWPT
jgi:hypothetical protein